MVQSNLPINEWSMSYERVRNSFYLKINPGKGGLNNRVEQYCKSTFWSAITVSSSLPYIHHGLGTLQGSKDRNSYIRIYHLAAFPGSVLDSLKLLCSGYLVSKMYKQAYSVFNLQFHCEKSFKFFYNVNIETSTK